jgi:exonuclease SbcD
VFGCGAVEAHSVGRRGELLAHVYGISYPRRDVAENLALGFRRLDAPGLHVGVLHCNVGSQPNHPAYSACSIADLTAAGLDYWALGHIHQHLRLGEGRPWIVYPGSLQAGKSSELGPRGAVLVEAEGAAVQRVDFVELDCVRFAHAEVNIAEERDLHSLRKTILAHAAADSRDLLLTITLIGRGPLHRDLRRPRALDDLLRDVRDELGISSPFVWVDRIEDRTRGALDRDAIRRRGDFAADLTRLVDRLRADPEALASFPASLDTGDSEDRESLLREAEERALDLLESEQER